CRACPRVRGSTGYRPLVRGMPGLGGCPIGFPRARAQNRALRRPVCGTPGNDTGCPAYALTDRDAVAFRVEVSDITLRVCTASFATGATCSCAWRSAACASYMSL